MIPLSMPMPFPVYLNYLFLSYAGVGVTFVTLRQLYPLRHSYALAWLYFTLKATVEGNLMYLAYFGSSTTNIALLQNATSLAIAILSFVVIYYTFEAEVIQLAVVAVFCDLAAGCCNIGSIALTTLLTGGSFEYLYLTPIGMATILSLVLFAIAYGIIRLPLLRLCRWLCRITNTNRPIWALVAISFMFLAPAYSLNAAELLATSVFVFAFYAAVTALLLVPLLVKRSRDIAMRQEAIAACAGLSAKYDETIGQQLLELEQERAVLEGHELTLNRLGEGASAHDAVLHERAERLKDSYERMCAGSYCPYPALDAVLVSVAQRLRDRGVQPRFTVAGIPRDVALPAATAFAFLNLACGAATRAEDVEGDEVELRVRAVGELLLLRLSIPISWGALGARRRLKPFVEETGGYVRERSHRGRTLVLMLTGGKRVA